MYARKNKCEIQFIVENIVQIDEMYLLHMGAKKQWRSLVIGIYEKYKQENLLKFARKYISSQCYVHIASKKWCKYKPNWINVKTYT
ncbi:hypothetical protein [Spiroplasma endosymbiont of Virgichneumon dumeticola]|uniref:hypothetical protein n=1 Tax=Spiroplasma endosymbiont of Virgichneumon dumeticola TaxID=3139323 RepID=UPI0035C93080